METRIIQTIIIGILLISCASALELKAGECGVLDVQINNPVTWNEVEGVTVIQNNSEIKVCLSPLFETTNFTLEFSVDQEPVIVYKSSGGSSSSGGTKYIYRDRNITDTKVVEVDKTIEVPGDTIEVIKTKTAWSWIIPLVGIIILLSGILIWDFIISRREDEEGEKEEVKKENGEEENKQ